MENEIFLSSPSSPLLDRLPQAQLAQLQEKKKLLERLCQEIDPYQTVDARQLALLHQLGITPQTSPDPFTLTNQLLLLLDQTTLKLADLEKLTKELGLSNELYGKY